MDCLKRNVDYWHQGALIDDFEVGEGPNSLSMNFLHQGDTLSPFILILLVYCPSRMLAILASSFLRVGIFYILTQ